MKTQFGNLITGDLGANTIKLEINGEMILKAGEYAIVPMDKYRSLVNGVENSTNQALNLPVVMPSVYGIFRHESDKVYGFYWSLEVAEEICNERDGEDWYVDELCIDQH